MNTYHNLCNYKIYKISNTTFILDDELNDIFSILDNIDEFNSITYKYVFIEKSRLYFIFEISDNVKINIFVYQSNKNNYNYDIHIKITILDITKEINGSDVELFKMYYRIIDNNLEKLRKYFKEHKMHFDISQNIAYGDSLYIINKYLGD